MSLRVLDHPLASDLLTVLRDVTTDSPRFRQTAERLGYLLVADALADMKTVDHAIDTPLEPVAGLSLQRPIVAVAVLRAGLGLLGSVLALIPDAAIGFAGVQRDEETAEPLEYYTKFPPLAGARVLMLEPMLATGGSLAWAVDQVKEKGATDITAVCVVVAPEGLAVMENRHADVDIVAAALDRELDDTFYIRPGLGDMGDRLFGTT